MTPWNFYNSLIDTAMSSSKGAIVALNVLTTILFFMTLYRRTEHQCLSSVFSFILTLIFTMDINYFYSDGSGTLVSYLNIMIYYASIITLIYTGWHCFVDMLIYPLEKIAKIHQIFKGDDS